MLTVTIMGQLSSRTVLSGGKPAAPGPPSFVLDLAIPHAISMSVNSYTHMSLIIVVSSAIYIFDLADRYVH